MHIGLVCKGLHESSFTMFGLHVTFLDGHREVLDRPQASVDKGCDSTTGMRACDRYTAKPPPFVALRLFDSQIDTTYMLQS